MARVNRNDPRRFHTSQAVQRNYGGKALESGPSGYGLRLASVVAGTITLEIDMGDTAPQLLGDLTQGMVITGLISLGEADAGTIAFELPAHGDQGLVTLISNASAAAGVKSLTAGAHVRIPVDRPLVATAAGGTPGQRGVFLLQVAHVDSGWY